MAADDDKTISGVTFGELKQWMKRELLDTAHSAILAQIERKINKLEKFNKILLNKLNKSENKIKELTKEIDEIKELYEEKEKEAATHDIKYSVNQRNAKNYNEVVSGGSDIDTFFNDGNIVVIGDNTKINIAFKSLHLNRGLWTFNYFKLKRIAPLLLNLTFLTCETFIEVLENYSNFEIKIDCVSSGSLVEFIRKGKSNIINLQNRKDSTQEISKLIDVKVHWHRAEIVKFIMIRKSNNINLQKMKDFTEEISKLIVVKVHWRNAEIIKFITKVKSNNINLQNMKASTKEITKLITVKAHSCKAEIVEFISRKSNYINLQNMKASTQEITKLITVKAHSCKAEIVEFIRKGESNNINLKNTKAFTQESAKLIVIKAHRCKADIVDFVTKGKSNNINLQNMKASTREIKAHYCKAEKSKFIMKGRFINNNLQRLCRHDTKGSYQSYNFIDIKAALCKHEFVGLRLGKQKVCPKAITKKRSLTPQHVMRDKFKVHQVTFLHRMHRPGFIESGKSGKILPFSCVFSGKSRKV